MVSPEAPLRRPQVRRVRSHLGTAIKAKARGGEVLDPCVGRKTSGTGPGEGGGGRDPEVGRGLRPRQLSGAGN